ncbi:MAG: phosphatase PAP2 family protein [Candidatus Dormibacteria bacterium]
MTAEAIQRDSDADATEPQQAAAEVLSGVPGAIGKRWLAVISLVSVVLFIVDTILVVRGTLLRGFDIPVEHAVQSVEWGPVATVMRLTNASGGWGQVILGLVAVAGLFLLERRAGLLMALGCIGSVIDSFIKVSISRHRPTTDLVAVLDPSRGYSYPSGHAVFFTWLAFMLAAALAPRVRPSARPILWLGALLLAVVVCLGRVWAGAHWPSDVIGGFLLALAWSAFVLWLPENWLPEPNLSWVRGRLRRTA